MKKLLVATMIIILVMFVSACKEKEITELKIIAPNGSPALSQTYVEYHLPEISYVNYEIDIVSGAELLVAAFGSGSHDIIFAPTNVGARLISTGVDYQFAATVNWGNSYIASKSDIQSLEDLDGKEIVAFGQNATPDIVLRTLINATDYSVEPTIIYVDSVQTALANLMEDSNRIVLLAEPILSIGQQNLGNLNIIDLQSEWASITGMASYPQAGIFVKSSLDSTIVDAYLAHVEEGINILNDDPELIANYAESLEYPFPKPVLINAIPRSNIRFETAVNSKEALEYYFEQILTLQGNLINNQLPDDAFYYNGN